jgi:hypothetical protein
MRAQRKEISFSPSEKFLSVKNVSLAGIVQSVQRFTMGWSVPGSNPAGTNILRTWYNRSEPEPATHTMGTRSLARG